MMVFEIIGIVLAIIVLALIINGVEDYHKNKKLTIIPYKELFEKTELIIAPFTSGNKELFFLLDTGSNLSHINKSSLDDIKYVNSDKTIDVFGMEGNIMKSDYCGLSISHGKFELNEEFVISDLENAFANIEQECGVHIDGIIGNDIMLKYNFNINFANTNIVIA